MEIMIPLEVERDELVQLYKNCLKQGNVTLNVDAGEMQSVIEEQIDGLGEQQR